MMECNIENILQCFALDTLVCALTKIDLREHMKEKHGWNDKQFDEFLNIYKINIRNIKHEQ